MPLIKLFVIISSGYFAQCDITSLCRTGRNICYLLLHIILLKTLLLNLFSADNNNNKDNNNYSDNNNTNSIDNTKITKNSSK